MLGLLRVRGENEFCWEICVWWELAYNLVPKLFGISQQALCFHSCSLVLCIYLAHLLVNLLTPGATLVAGEIYNLTCPNPGDAACNMQHRMLTATYFTSPVEQQCLAFRGGEDFWALPDPKMRKTKAETKQNYGVEAERLQERIAPGIPMGLGMGLGLGWT